MQNGKKLFSLLGGIFLMASGTMSILLTLIRLIGRMTYFNYQQAFSIQLLLLCILCGLFLLLRKKLPAAIMMSVAALFCLVRYFSALGLSITHGQALNFILLFLNFSAFAVFAVGLYFKRLTGFILCLVAAGVRFLTWMIGAIRMIVHGGFSAIVFFDYCAVLLLVAGMVMAAFYLKGSRETEPESWNNTPPQGWNYAAPQDWNPVPQQQNNNGGWRPYP